MCLCVWVAKVPLGALLVWLIIHQSFPKDKRSCPINYLRSVDEPIPPQRKAPVAQSVSVWYL